MDSFFKIIKYDYLQRTRSYGFLITLCVSLAIGYTFVPEPDAGYSTIRIGDHIGYYNSAWFGYVTAIMTSTFLSLIGFYLVNSSIKTDADTRVGQIMAATPIKNINYLLSKTLSNFLVLLTIVLLVFLMSIVLFFLYHDSRFSFEIWQFIKPYLIITIPTMFVISALAVLSEVIFGRFSTLQNVGFFFLFSLMMLNTSTQKDLKFMTDVFGNKIVIHHMEEKVKEISGDETTNDMTIGYVTGNTTKAKKFEFKGVEFPIFFILSRILWMLLSVFLIIGMSAFFHRFNFRKQFNLKKRKTSILPEGGSKQVLLSRLPSPQIDYSIFTLLKTEIMLLIRHGKKWMWIINVAGMVALGFLPLEMAHQLVLPVLWFLQVGRLSELTSKEIANNVHYFTFSSFKPLTRLLTSQILAASLLMVLLASPLLIRHAIEGAFIPSVSILIGACGIVLFAAVLGILSKGKKLFEVLFFLISYANINGIAFLDYFGGINTNSAYLIKMVCIVVGLATLGFITRKYQLQK